MLSTVSGSLIMFNLAEEALLVYRMPSSLLDVMGEIKLGFLRRLSVLLLMAVSSLLKFGQLQGS